MKRGIPKVKEFPNDGRTWRVDWFGGVERNYEVPSEPKVQVIISPLIEGVMDYASSKAVDHTARISITIGIGQLPIVTVGSLWKNRQCLRECAGKTRLFNGLQISGDTVQLLKSDAIVDGEHLIRGQFHRIGSGLAANCLAVSWQGDPYGIVIPVAEIIRFYYATSTDLAKAIFAGDFRHDLNSIVNPAECGFNEQEKRCFLKLRKGFADADAYIIARILFGSEAFSGAAQVHDSLIKEAIHSKPRVYPEAGFPFSGETNLRARIKSMQTPDGQRWRHIVFALEHCSGSFPFEAITCDRDNNNLSANPDTDLPDDEKQEAFHQVVNQLSDAPPGEFQSDEEPSHDLQGVLVTLPEDRFGALSGMDLEKPEKEMCHYINSGELKPLAPPTQELGTGDGTYAENAVTPTSIELEHIRQAALPASFENFQAVIKLLNAQPGIQASIRQRTPAIAYIPLTKPRGQRQWSYLDSDTKQRRNVAIADLYCRGKAFSLVEFEWRECESFKLAMLSCVEPTPLSDQMMAYVLRVLAKKEGRWQSLDSQLPNVTIQTLKHTWATIPDYASALIERMYIEIT